MRAAVLCKLCKSRQTDKIKELEQRLNCHFRFIYSSSSIGFIFLLLFSSSFISSSLLFVLFVCKSRSKYVIFVCRIGFRYLWLTLRREFIFCMRFVLFNSGIVLFVCICLCLFLVISAYLFLILAFCLYSVESNGRIVASMFDQVIWSFDFVLSYAKYEICFVLG